MTSNRPKFDDHAFDFEALVSDSSTKNDAALTEWAMGSADSQGRQREPQPVRSRTPAQPAAPPAPPRGRTGSSAVPRGSRGQVLSWTVVVLAVVLSTVLGYGAYAALNAVDVRSADSLATASHWMTLPVTCGLGLVATLVLAIVALFRARPRLVATVGFVLTLLLPVAAAAVGFKFGADVLVQHVHDSADLVGSRAADYVTGLLNEQGVDVGPLTTLVEWVFG